MQFDFKKKDRLETLGLVIEKLETYYNATKSLKTNPELNIDAIRGLLLNEELEYGTQPEKAIDHIIYGLETYAVHTPHPKYFGLFNPRSNFAGILADLIAATYNPQLAGWSHAPFAVEVEDLLIREFAAKFGYKSEQADGVFKSGGAEANLTALLCALNHNYPNLFEEGLIGMDKKPVIFCSKEAHHSIQKAVKIVGLGTKLIKSISITDESKLDTDILEQELKKLDYSVYAPLMVIGTAGTTGTGTIDDLHRLSTICKKYNMWFHVDAAYGGGAILSSDLKPYLSGIEKSDSITFDAHKWMSVPMGTSIFLTQHHDILEKTFGISTPYMPKDDDGLKVTQPFTRSIQWSRRFIGLKVYLSLLIYGWKGYEQTINHQAGMGRYLKRRLREEGWSVINDTVIPVVCFTKEEFKNDMHFTQHIIDNILKNGTSWLSLYPIDGISTLRACITNYNTTEVEIEELITELNQEAASYMAAVR